MWIIRDLTHKHNATKNATVVIVDSDTTLYLGCQGKTEPIDEHYGLFKSKVDTTNAHGGAACHHHAQKNTGFSCSVWLGRRIANSLDLCIT